MGDLAERRSQIVLTPEERAAVMEAEGKTPEEIEATLSALAHETMRRQAEYDKAPPKYYRPEPPS